MQAALLTIGMGEEAERALEASIRAEGLEEMAQRVLETQQGAIVEHSKVTARLEELEREEGLSILTAVSRAEAPLRAKIRELREAAVKTSEEVAAATVERSRLETELHTAVAKLREAETRLASVELDLAAARDEAKDANEGKEELSRILEETRSREAEALTKAGEAETLRDRLTEVGQEAADLRGRLALAEALLVELKKGCASSRAVTFECSTMAPC